MLLLKFLLALFMVGEPESLEVEPVDNLDCFRLTVEVAKELGTTDLTFNDIFEYGLANPDKLRQANECGYFELDAFIEATE